MTTMTLHLISSCTDSRIPSSVLTHPRSSPRRRTAKTLIRNVALSAAGLAP